MPTELAPDQSTIFSNLEQLHRLQLINSTLNQNGGILHQLINQAQHYDQQQQQIQSAGSLLTQLLTLRSQLMRPAANLFVAPPQPPQLVLPNGLQQHLIHLISQQLLVDGGNTATVENEGEESAKDEQIDLVDI
jgi:hypothetical protein